MSGEFREFMGLHFMWQVLEECGTGEVGEPVADALTRVYAALAPLERAVAWHQAGDSGHSRVVLACVEHFDAVGGALSELQTAMLANKRLVEDLVRKAKP